MNGPAFLGVKNRNGKSKGKGQRAKLKNIFAFCFLPFDF